MSQRYTFTLSDGTPASAEVGEGQNPALVYMALERAHIAKKTDARNSKIQEFVSQVDTTPREMPTRPPVNVSGGGHGLSLATPTAMATARGEGVEQPTQESPDRLLKIQNSAQAGTDVTTGLPAGVRGKIRTVGGTNSVRQLAATEHFVRQQYKELGIEIPDGTPIVYVDESTGEPAYLRPERVEQGGGWGHQLIPTLVNPYGTDAGDVLEVTPLAAQIILEAGGSLAGAASGKAVGGGGPTMTLGAAVGSAGMSIITNLARQQAARAWGLDEEMVNKIQSDEMLFDAAMAFGSDAAFGGVYALYRGINNAFWKPLDVSPEKLAAMGKEMSERASEVMTLNDILKLQGGDVIVPQLEILGDAAETMVFGAQTRRSAKDHAGRSFAEVDIHNRMTFGTAARRIEENRFPSLPEVSRPYSDVGRDAAQIIQRPAREVAAQGRNAVEELRRGVDNLPSSSPEAWSGVQRSIRETQEALHQAEQTAWNKFYGTNGPEGHGIRVDPKTKRADIWLRNAPTSPVRSWLRNRSKEQLDELAPIVGASRNQLFRDLGIDTSEGTARAMDPGFPNLLDDALDLRQLHILVSTLKGKSRNMAEQIPGWSRREVNELIVEIEKQIRNSPMVYNFDYRALLGKEGIPDGIVDRTSRVYVSGPERRAIRNSYFDAIETTVEKHGFENYAFLTNAAEMRRVPGTRDFEFVQGTDTIRGVFLKPNNSNALIELRALYGKNPGMEEALQRELHAKFRQIAMPDGKWSQTAADRFMHEHASHMELLFGKEGSQRIRDVGSMAAEMQRTQAKNLHIQGALEQAFGKKFSGAEYTGDIAKDILRDTRLTSGQLNRLTGRLRRADPELWADIQKQGLEYINKTLSTGKGAKELSWTQLDKLLEPRTAERLTALYGPGYVSDLTQLRDVYKHWGNVSIAKGYPESVQTVALQVGRSLMGPLSKKQRFLTSVNRALRVMSNAQFQRYMTDPSTLASWNKIHGYEAGSYAAAHLAMRLPPALVEALDDETQRRVSILRQMANQGGMSPGFQAIRDATSNSPDEFGDDDDSD